MLTTGTALGSGIAFGSLFNHALNEALNAKGLNDPQDLLVAFG